MELSHGWLAGWLAWLDGWLAGNAAAKAILAEGLERLGPYGALVDDADGATRENMAGCLVARVRRGRAAVKLF